VISPVPLGPPLAGAGAAGAGAAGAETAGAELGIEGAGTDARRTAGTIGLLVGGGGTEELDEALDDEVTEADLVREKPLGNSNKAGLPVALCL